MSILVAFVCLILIWILVKSILERKNQRLYQLLKQFPSHPIYPLIGNCLQVGMMHGLLEKLDIIVEKYDRQVFWFGPIPFLLLKKYNDITTVLSQCQDRDMMGIGNEWLGIGIITARHKAWKTSRRILNLAFTSKMLSTYLQVFNKNAAVLVENLKSVADTDKEVDVLRFMMDVSLNSIVENSMGVLCRNDEKSEREFCNAIQVAPLVEFNRFRFPWLFPNHIYNLYLKITKKIRMTEHMKFLPTQILRKKLNELQDLQHLNNIVDDANSSRTVIDLLIKTSVKEKDFTETRMRDELLQIMVSGVETTALSLSFLLLMLAMNQDIQQKVYEEILQFSKQHNKANDEITESDLKDHFAYLEKCIKETVRLFSPVAHDIRRTHRDILLDGKIIPANVLVVTFIYAANRDSELYENPFKWDPEHFSDQAVKKRPKTGELTFGYGARNCIGAKYAMLNIKTQAIYVLRRYHLSTQIEEVTNKDLYLDLGIKSKLGYPVKFTSR